jgi:hypothetical protein
MLGRDLVTLDERRGAQARAPAVHKDLWTQTRALGTDPAVNAQTMHSRGRLSYVIPGDNCRNREEKNATGLFEPAAILFEERRSMLRLYVRVLLVFVFFERFRFDSRLQIRRWRREVFVSTCVGLLTTSWQRLSSWLCRFWERLFLEPP